MMKTIIKHHEHLSELMNLRFQIRVHAQFVLLQYAGVLEYLHALNQEGMCRSISSIKTGMMFIFLIRDNLISIKVTLSCNQVIQTLFLSIIFTLLLQDLKMGVIIPLSMTTTKKLLILRKHFPCHLDTICLLPGTD